MRQASIYICIGSNVQKCSQKECPCSFHQGSCYPIYEPSSNAIDQQASHKIFLTDNVMHLLGTNLYDPRAVVNFCPITPQGKNQIQDHLVNRQACHPLYQHSYLPEDLLASKINGQLYNHNYTCKHSTLHY